MNDSLMHFNRNHDPKTGRFFFGDGDGDGIDNDHAHRSSLREKARNARDAHRGRVIEEENYKITRGNLKLRQDQIANQRSQEQTDVALRKMSLKEQRQQAKIAREEQKRQMQEQKAQRMVERLRQKNAMELEKANRMEAKAKELVAREETKRMRNEQREQRKAYEAQVRAERDAMRAEEKRRSDYSKEIRRQTNLADRYANKSKHKSTSAWIALATGRPITAISRGISAVSYDKKARQIINNQYGNYVQ